MWHELAVAFALMLVLEGIAPFLNPGAFRRFLLQAARYDDATLRFAGLSCMLLGVLLLTGLSSWR